jgi:hypothetical protein
VICGIPENQSNLIYSSGRSILFQAQGGPAATSVFKVVFFTDGHLELTAVHALLVSPQGPTEVTWMESKSVPTIRSSQEEEAIRHFLRYLVENFPPLLQKLDLRMRAALSADNSRLEQ